MFGRDGAPWHKTYARDSIRCQNFAEFPKGRFDIEIHHLANHHVPAPKLEVLQGSCLGRGWFGFSPWKPREPQDEILISKIPQILGSATRSPGILELWGALFRDRGGPAPAGLFWTLRGFGPEGPGRPCAGGGVDPNPNSKIKTTPFRCHPPTIYPKPEFPKTAPLSLRGTGPFSVPEKPLASVGSPTISTGSPV